MVDIKKIFFDGVLPQQHKPAEALSLEAALEPAWIDRLRDGVADAIDYTTVGMNSFIKKPVIAVGREAAITGSVITGSTVGGIRAGWKSTLARVRKTGNVFSSGRGPSDLVAKWIKGVTTACLVRQGAKQ